MGYGKIRAEIQQLQKSISGDAAKDAPVQIKLARLKEQLRSMEQVRKFNPNHDKKDGRFTSSQGGGAGADPAGKGKEAERAAHHRDINRRQDRTERQNRQATGAGPYSLKPEGDAGGSWKQPTGKKPGMSQAAANRTTDAAGGKSKGKPNKFKSRLDYDFARQMGYKTQEEVDAHFGRIKDNLDSRAREMGYKDFEDQKTTRAAELGIDIGGVRTNADGSRTADVPHDHPLSNSGLRHAGVVRDPEPGNAEPSSSPEPAPSRAKVVQTRNDLKAYKEIKNGLRENKASLLHGNSVESARLGGQIGSLYRDADGNMIGWKPRKKNPGRKRNPGLGMPD